MKSLLEYIIYALGLITSSGVLKDNSEEDKSPEEVKDAYKWLIKEMKDENSTNVQKYNKPWLTPGKIYVFKYQPIPDKYQYWDQHPIVLALGKMKFQNGKTYNVGINISWYPPKARKYIIEEIAKIYRRDIEKGKKTKPYKANEQNPIYFDLFALKLQLDKAGFSFAIRNYDPTKIQSNYCIAFEHWDKAIVLDQPKIFPELKGVMSLSEIYKEFKNYILSYSARRSEILKKMEENKKLNKYRFIK